MVLKHTHVVILLIIPKLFLNFHVSPNAYTTFVLNAALSSAGLEGFMKRRSMDRKGESDRSGDSTIDTCPWWHQHVRPRYNVPTHHNSIPSCIRYYFPKDGMILKIVRGFLHILLWFMRFQWIEHWIKIGDWDVEIECVLFVIEWHATTKCEPRRLRSSRSCWKHPRKVLSRTQPLAANFQMSGQATLRVRRQLCDSRLSDATD